MPVPVLVALSRDILVVENGRVILVPLEQPNCDPVFMNRPPVLSICRGAAILSRERLVDTRPSLVFLFGELSVARERKLNW